MHRNGMPMYTRSDQLSEHVLKTIIVLLIPTDNLVAVAVKNIKGKGVYVDVSSEDGFPVSLTTVKELSSIM